METSVWWIEHVIATDGMPLARSTYVSEMYWFTYHSVDVVVVLASGIFIMAAIFCRLFAYVCNQQKKQKRGKKEKKMKKK